MDISWANLIALSPLLLVMVYSFMLVAHDCVRYWREVRQNRETETKDGKANWSGNKRKGRERSHPSDEDRWMLLIIVRGLPGSGKTTLAESLGYKHLEPDSYFMRHDGEYRFSQNDVGYAHQWCRKELERNLKKGHSVTVSHTFIKNWEMREYCDVAKRNGAKVQVIEVYGPWKDVHGVPQETIERMKMLWEPFYEETLRGWEW